MNEVGSGMAAGGDGGQSRTGAEVKLNLFSCTTQYEEIE